MINAVSYGSMCLISLTLGFRLAALARSSTRGPIVGVLAQIVLVPSNNNRGPNNK